MGILPMSRRAILALQSISFPHGRDTRAASQTPVQVFCTELCGQVDQLGRRDEEPVIVGGEITTGAAGIAPAGPARLFLLPRVDPVVERRYFFDESAVLFGFSHHHLFSRILSISSQL
jgi:hypothetical protein